MKINRMFLMAVMAATIALAGCSKSSSTGSSVDTSAMEKSFTGSEPATQSEADKAVAAIKSADYAGALTQLQALAAKAQLTPEQQQAVKDVIAAVQKMVGDTAAKAAGDATKAAAEMPNPLKK